MQSRFPITTNVAFFNSDLGYSSGLARMNPWLEGRDFPLHIGAGVLEEPLFIWNVPKKHVIQNDQNVTEDGYSDDRRHDENAPGNRGPDKMAHTRLKRIDRGKQNHRYRNSADTVPAHTQSVTPRGARVVAKLSSGSRRVPKRNSRKPSASPIAPPTALGWLLAVAVAV